MKPVSIIQDSITFAGNKPYIIDFSYYQSQDENNIYNLEPSIFLALSNYDNKNIVDILKSQKMLSLDITTLNKELSIFTDIISSALRDAYKDSILHKTLEKMNKSKAGYFDRIGLLINDFDIYTKDTIYIVGVVLDGWVVENNSYRKNHYRFYSIESSIRSYNFYTSSIQEPYKYYEENILLNNIDQMKMQEKLQRMTFDFLKEFIITINNNYYPSIINSCISPFTYSNHKKFLDAGYFKKLFKENPRFTDTEILNELNEIETAINRLENKSIRLTFDINKY